MKKEIRAVSFDPEMGVEAYEFKGIMQKFPNHFHDYYVVGFIESGQRLLSCRNMRYTLGAGDLVLFNPGDNHTCEQVEGGTLDYRCININQDVMRRAALEITGKDFLPYFSENVLFQSELVAALRELHAMIMLEEEGFKKEELFLFLMQQLIEDFADSSPAAVTGASEEINSICDYLESNYMDNIALKDLSAMTGLNKYYLIRSFTKQKGISPYCYLETVRIGKAKKLLEQGTAPIDAALQTGFADQSHFTNFFKRLIGLTPKQYLNIFKNEERCNGNTK
jgi:AraC-like DNA-binding protein/mannose-6-phosphate isomerase-like protein (cupin superfamily)